MAFPWTPLITLFSISSTVTLANATLLGGILGGVITCTNTSVAVAGTYNVISQAQVDLVCGAGGMSLPVVIQSTQTNINGLYTFLISSADTIFLDGGNCYLNVTIPTTSCVFNVPTGVLRMPVSVLTTIDALVGNILSFGSRGCQLRSYQLTISAFQQIISGPHNKIYQGNFNLKDAPS